MSNKPSRAVENAAVRIDETPSTALKSVVIAFIFSLLFVMAARAQTVAGTVVDAATGKPVAEAIVAVVNPTAKDTLFTPFRANAQGRFVITPARGGTYRLQASRDGYTTIGSEEVSIEPAQVAMLQVSLADSAAMASGTTGSIRVVATRTLSQAELMSPLGFDIRRARAIGAFVAQEDMSRYGRVPFETILKDNATRLSLEFAVDRTFMTETILMKRGSGVCFPEVRLDGMPLAGVRGTSLSRFSGYAANQIYGVEVYRPTQLPSPRMAGEIGTSAPDCGVVAVWTNAQQLLTSQQLWRGGSQR